MKRQFKSIPRIDIKKTVTNDIRIMLDLLIPTKDLARLLYKYDTFLFEHLAEMRLICQIIDQNNDSDVDSQNDTKYEKKDSEQKSSRKISWLINMGPLLR
jgi:hypothetical protein